MSGLFVLILVEGSDRILDTFEIQNKQRDDRLCVGHFWNIIFVTGL